jgi:anti-sigma-K factor RskA
MMAADDDLEVLAGEYVLGMLAPDEHRAVERRLLDNPDLARRVAGWEDWLAPLSEDLPPVTPRPEVWQRLRFAVTGRRREPRAWWWDRVGLWRGWAAAATAAAAGLAALVLLRPPAEPQLVAVLSNPEGRPLWVVQASAEEGRPLWVARASAEAGGLLTRSLAGRAAPGRVPELWLFPPEGQAPVSLGVLDPAGVNRRSLAEPAQRALEPGDALAVSLEPPGGSPTGAPTGPVVSRGVLVAEPL